MGRPRNTPEPTEDAAEPEVLQALEARAALGEVLDRKMGTARIEAIVDACLEKAAEGDLSAVRALDKLLSQAKGTPKQTHSVEMNMRVAAVRTMDDLKALTEDELAMIAAGAGAVRAALPIGGSASVGD